MSDDAQGIYRRSIAGIRGGVALSSARVYNSAAISIPNATATYLTFDTERWDDEDYHDTGSNTGRLTIPANGRYLVGAQVRFAANGTGERYVFLKVNRSTYIGGGLVSGSAFLSAVPPIVALWEATVDDYIEVEVYQTSGGALNVDTATAYSPEFWIMQVGR